MNRLNPSIFHGSSYGGFLKQGSPCSSSISIGFSMEKTHLFWGTPILGNLHMSSPRPELTPISPVLLWHLCGRLGCFRSRLPCTRVTSRSGTRQGRSRNHGMKKTYGLDLIIRYPLMNVYTKNYGIVYHSMNGKTFDWAIFTPKLSHYQGV